MTRLWVVGEEADRVSSPLDRPGLLLAKIAAGLALSVAPWWFGGVMATAQLWLFAAAIGALVAYLVSRLGIPASIPWAAVPLVMAALLGAGQLLPLPPAVSRLVSPHSYALQTELPPSPDAAALSNPPGGAEDSDTSSASTVWRPTSLYPAATRRDVALLLLGVSFFLLGAWAFRTAIAAVALCGVLAGTGGAVAFYGIVQKLSWNGLLFGTVSIPNATPFGPFINHNNAAGFLLLGLAGALGLFVAGMLRYAGPLDSPARMPARRRTVLAGGVGRLDGGMVLALFLASMTVAGVFASLSRGGVLALAAGAIATLGVLIITRRGHPLWLPGGAVVLLAIGLVTWLGLGDATRARLATLFTGAATGDVRLVHWQDSLRAAPDYWRAGAGLGTYRYAYRPYQQDPMNVWFHYAENQYLEALVVAGAPGLVLLLVALAVVGWAAWRLLHASDGASVALGATAAFALTSQAVAALFDFGLYMPANLIAGALVCGAASGRAAALAQPGSLARPSTLPVRFARSGLALGLLAALTWGAWETSRCAAVESVRGALQLPANGPKALSDDNLAARIRQVEAAVAARPDDAEVHRGAAELWIARYRLAALDRSLAAARPDAKRSELWKATSPQSLHGQAHLWARMGLGRQLEILRNDPLVQQYLGPAVDHLRRAVAACPLMTEAYMQLAALSWLDEPLPMDQVLLDCCCRLAPRDPDVQFLVGRLDWQAGRYDRAWQHWRASLSASPRHLAVIMPLARQRATAEELVETLLPDQVTLLLEVARTQFHGTQDAAARRALGQHIERVVPTSGLSEAERFHAMGIAASLQGNYRGSIVSWRRAVSLRPAETEWRFQLATLLQQEGRLAEAHRQARICAQLASSSEKYHQLLREINRTRLQGVTAED